MRIILFTTGYPSKNNPVGATPVVHYFTREWIKLGNEVIVFHLEKQYPKFILWLSRLFESKLYSILGNPVRTKIPVEYDEINEGVEVHHRILRKSFLSKRYYKEDIFKFIDIVNSFCDKRGRPDIFVGHWDNPQLEILHSLKKEYPYIRNALVMHSINHNLKKFYSKEWRDLFESIDALGFRNYPALLKFKEEYFVPKHSFVASSGISDAFADNSQRKPFENDVRSFVYVGALIKRKYPLNVLAAITKVYKNKPYLLTYIGTGDESRTIKKYYDRYGGAGHLEMTGRIPRDRVIDYLRKAEVFVMISDHETFGLVYLEAMAMGCITVASKGCGVDGIIVHGENGFLCKPGNTDSLVEIIEMIRNLTKEEKELISENAVKTALAYTDSNVAKAYLKEITDNGVEFSL